MADHAPNSSTLAFLDGESATVQQRAARLSQALQHCDGCLEDETLRASLRHAETEQKLLWSLRQTQTRNGRVSFEAILMRRISRSRQDSRRLSQNWRRGQATPAGYWDAELQREFLSGLLRRYRAWRVGPRTPPARTSSSGPGVAGQAYPWFIAPEPDEQGRRPSSLNAQEIEALQQTLQQALQGVIDPGHVALVVQPDGQVILTGYAHSDAQREQALQTILDTDGVREVISDLKVLPPERCPACRPPRERPAPGAPTTPPPA